MPNSEYDTETGLWIGDENRYLAIKDWLTIGKAECVAKMVAALKDYVEACPEVMNPTLDDVQAEAELSDLVGDTVEEGWLACQSFLDDIGFEVECYEPRKTRMMRQERVSQVLNTCFEALKPPTLEQMKRWTEPSPTTK